MKKLCIALLISTSSGLALADHSGSSDYAKVVSTYPVYEEVAYNQPQEHCWQETVRHRSSDNSAAPILGAIIGGAIGNELGHGHHNRHVGTFVGAALGASIGGEVANQNRGGHYAVEQRCDVIDEVRYRQEVVGYDVTYRYHGRDYHTRMPYDPGRRIKVRVDVTPLD